MYKPNTLNKRAVIYVRVSSDNQVDGTSLDYQESQCRKYCEEKGMEVVAIYREEGASAKTSQRKEFLKAIEFCRRHKKKTPIDAFVVQKCDRFARNTEDHMMVRRKLLDYGARLHSVSEPIDDTVMGKMFETIMSAFAEFDNEIRRERSVNGMSEKIKQGLWPWGAPCGYTAHQFRKRDEKMTLPCKPHPRIFPILQKGLKQLANGGYKTQQQLAEDLDKMGLRQERGKKTYGQFTACLLSEKRLKFYSGMLENPFDGKDYPGQHEPIISPREAENIRLWLKQNRTQPDSKMVFRMDFPLRQLVQCECCGQGLTGAFSKGRSKRYRYYWCYNADCQEYHKSIKAEIMEEKFEALVTSIVPNAQFWEWFKVNVEIQWKDKKKVLKNREVAYNRKLQGLMLKKKRLEDMYLDGLLASREEYLERKDRLENQITTLRISYSETRIENLDIDLLIKEAQIYTSSLGKLWKNLVHPDQRTKFMRFVFPDGISYNRKTNNTNQAIGLIFRINKEFETSEKNLAQKSTLVLLSGFPLNQIVEELMIFQPQKTHS